MAGFGDRLYKNIQEIGPLCVGIDPHPHLLQAWGLEDSTNGIEKFSQAVLEAAVGRAAALKPQVALFERHGSAGIRVLENLLKAARASNIPVIADAKRGDIGSTMKAYAEAWLPADSPLESDALTISPYLGFESLRPALDAATAHGKGTFVLALTSNPEGRTVQHTGYTESGGSVARQIIAAAQLENTAQTWEHMGSCGLVVGATVGQALQKLGIDLSVFNGPILAPGYGAQGASAQDLYRVFAGVQSQVLVNSSRSILVRGPGIAAMIEGIERANEELRRAK